MLRRPVLLALLAEACLCRRHRAPPPQPSPLPPAAESAGQSSWYDDFTSPPPLPSWLSLDNLRPEQIFRHPPSPRPPWPPSPSPPPSLRSPLALVAFGSAAAALLSLLGLVCALRYASRVRAEFQRYARLTALELTAGIEGTAEASTTAAHCIVCLDRPRSARFACGHGCCCLSCAVRLQQRGAACPLCRKKPLLIVDTGEHVGDQPTAVPWSLRGWRAAASGTAHATTAGDVGDGFEEFGMSPLGLSPAQRRLAAACRVFLPCWQAARDALCPSGDSREARSVVILCLAGALWTGLTYAAGMGGCGGLAPSCRDRSAAAGRRTLQLVAAASGVVAARSSTWWAVVLLPPAVGGWALATLWQLAAVLQHCHYCFLPLISVSWHSSHCHSSHCHYCVLRLPPATSSRSVGFTPCTRVLMAMRSCLSPKRTSVSAHALTQPTDRAHI